MSKVSKLLIVTDSSAIKKAVELALVEKQFEVKSVAISAETGQLILSTIKEWNPDIIIVDSTISKNKAFSLEKNTARVILLCNSLEEKEIHQYKVDATLKKPFDRTTLLKTINSVIEAKKPPHAIIQKPQAQTLTPELEKIVRQVIEKIGWEVVPRLSESILKEEINKLLKPPHSK